MKHTTNYEDTGPVLSATTAEGMENECIAMAYELVARRLKEGTASSAETVHFLKMGSARERYEKQLMEKEIALKDAKTEALESAKRVEQLYNDAIEAMRSYAGLGSQIDDEY